jgi:hypothetical protein
MGFFTLCRYALQIISYFLDLKQLLITKVRSINYINLID